MLRINLLPIKAARKHDTAKFELLVFMGGVGVLVLALFLFHSVRLSDLKETEDRIAAVKKQIEQLKQDVVRVEDFKKKAATLEKKIKVINDLQTKRISPAKMLDEIATILTDQDKVWLSKLDEKDGKLVFSGGAMEHEDISEFQLALERRAKLIKDVKLTVVAAKKFKDHDYLEWNMECTATYRDG
ncbi:MAG: hypothetical protein A2289_15215 [Deltaproteobacteria bacterium RIFOXYA12_FULL_58_15]|nr:MAG: hypothetical protein A2289_15215 [Deltaproteobacteria bacterium RIFOXYA12_FULL_58_15]